MMHRLQFLLIAIVTLPLVLMPLPIAQRIGAWFGGALFSLLESRRFTAIGNIAYVKEKGLIRDARTPEQIARDNYRNMGRVLVEIAFLCWGRGKSLTDQVVVEGMEHFDQALARGKGIVSATGHFGNWELNAIAHPALSGDVVGVARKQRNPYIDRAIVRSRSRYGGSTVYKEGAARAFLTALKRGGTVFVIMDEPFWRDKGVTVDFIGQRAEFSKMAATLANRTGATVLPHAVIREGDKYVFRILPAIPMSGDDDADTQRIVNFLEETVCTHPDQWLQWLRKWKWLR